MQCCFQSAERKGRHCQQIILCLVEVSSKNEGENKIFLYEQMMREFVACLSSLQEMLKRVFQAEIKIH